MMKALILICVTLYCAIATATIISPKSGTIWKVGQKVTLKIDPVQPDETISGFFFHSKAKTLFGGPLTKSEFEFVVPHEAIDPRGSFSELVVVHRKQRFLQSVDSVQIKVVT